MNEKYLSVTALNRYLKAKLESDPHLGRLFIQGELSNVKYHSSGHCYFTLKDDKSRISAVMFSTYVKKIPFRLEDGMKVLMSARLSIYEPQGTYQLYVDQVEMDGLGNLFMAYERLRLKLEKNGLFSELHKKAIPLYPEKIGVITASTGAAIHDIIRTIRLTCPSAKVYFYPSLVQGDGAAKNLCEMVKTADKDKLDVIIIGRGGGSLEDLWAFNDEELAYTIYEANTPIISGVGHESDVTICDFVADYRAATPTAAAQKACFNQQELSNQLSIYLNQMNMLCQNKLKQKKKDFEHLSNHVVFTQPQRLYENALVRLDELETRMHLRMDQQLTFSHLQLDKFKMHFKKDMDIIFHSQNQQLSHYQFLMEKNMNYQLERQKKKLLYAVSNLNHLNPLNVIERGFTLTIQNEKIITSKKDISKQEPLWIRFKDGDLEVRVEEDEHEKNEL